MISNVIEQLFRLIIISIFLPKLVKYGPIISVTTYILFNILSESTLKNDNDPIYFVN